MPDATDIHIRRASPDDASALRAILYNTFESTWLPELTPAAALKYRKGDKPRNYVANRGTLFWVAECVGTVIGFVYWDADFVNALHVLSSHARKGVGHRLMDKAETEIAASGFPSARLPVWKRTRSILARSHFTPHAGIGKLTGIRTRSGTAG